MKHESVTAQCHTVHGNYMLHVLGQLFQPFLTQFPCTRCHIKGRNIGNNMWLIPSKPTSCLQKCKLRFKNVLRVHLISFKMTPYFKKLDNKLYFYVPRKVQISYVFLYNLLSSFGDISKLSRPTTGRFQCDESHMFNFRIIHNCC